MRAHTASEGSLALERNIRCLAEFAFSRLRGFAMREACPELPIRAGCALHGPDHESGFPDRGRGFRADRDFLIRSA